MDRSLKSQARISRKKERTREGLVVAAEELFAARGPDAVSIDDITEAADVAKGTFYNHFTDKDDLAHHIARIVRHELEAQVTRTNDGIADAAVRMANGLSCFLSFAVHQPTRARTLMRMIAGSADPAAPINAGLKGDVVLGLKTKRFDVPSPESGVLLAMGACVTACAYLVDAKPANPASVAANAVTVVLRGLGVKSPEAATLAKAAIAAAFAARKNEGGNP